MTIVPADKSISQAFRRSHLHSALSGDLRRQLIIHCHILFRTAELYEPANETYKHVIAGFLKILEQSFLQEADVTLEWRDNYWYVNGDRTRLDREGHTAGEFLAELFSRHGVGKLGFEPGLDSSELVRFCDIFLHSEGAATDSFRRLSAQLESAGLTHVKLQAPLPKLAGYVDLFTIAESRRAARRTFFYAVSMVESIMRQSQTGKPFNLLKTKRIVHTIVDQIIQDEGALVELATLKTYDDYTFAHSVNVSVLAITLGLRLGLDRNALSLLGFAALFHDVGKTKLPVELLNKAGELDEPNRKEMQKHPFLGAKVLAQTRRIDEYTARSMLVAFRHHINYDLTGYPRETHPHQSDLFTRIVKIADAYNAMTSGRVYVKEPMRPDEALRRMLAVSGTVYDPLLLKVFIQVLGVFPVGSLVLLNTGELAIVFRTNQLDLAHPQVRIIADHIGPKEELTIVDLADHHPESNDYLRSIVRVVDPQKYGINLSVYTLT